MMAALRHIWNVAVPDPAGVLPSDESALRTSIEHAREKLRDALTAREHVEQKLSEAQAATERVQSLISAAGTAEQEAEVAAEAAAAATREWAESGADSNIFAGNQTLLDRATDAQRAAQRARLQADGAAAGLPRVENAETAARLAVRQSEDVIRDAVGAVILTHLEEIREKAEKARADYLAAMEELRSARELLAGIGRNGEFVKFRCAAGSTVGEWIAELEIAEDKPRSEVDRFNFSKRLLPRAREYADFAQRLVADPDAVFDV